MENCPHCDAPLKPAARFCLACDRPIEDTSRLSVGDAVVTKKGRPLVAILAAAAAALGLAGLAYGGLVFVHHQKAHSKAVVVGDVKRGTRLIVDAEAGQAHACQRATHVLAGSPSDVERECAGIVGHDPGARVVSVKVDRLQLDGTTGTAHLHATVSDAQGTHTLDQVVDLVRDHRVWRMSWNGRPEI